MDFYKITAKEAGWLKENFSVSCYYIYNFLL